MARPFPYRLVPCGEELQNRFGGMREGLVRVEGAGGYIMPGQYTNLAEKYYNFKFKADDVVVMTHPRCGTTWMQEVVWMMRNNLQFDTDKNIYLRSPFLEFDSIEDPDLSPGFERFKDSEKELPGKDFQNTRMYYLNLAMTSPSPRTIKTHLTFSLLNPDLLDTSKVIYMARNPRDACVSYYHHQRLVKVYEYLGDFVEFVDLFCKDLSAQGPFWQHVKEAWERRNHPNLLFVYYEDMKESPLEQLARINTFLGTGLSAEQLEALDAHTSVQAMKGRATVNPTAANVASGRFKANEEEFIRKGVTGDWTRYFTPELDQKFQRWMDQWKDISRVVPFRYHI